MLIGVLMLLAVSEPDWSAAVADVDIMALNEEMVLFLDSIEKSQDPGKLAHALVYKIFNENALNLEYDNSKTRTAIETFNAGSGNCLSFTFMFVTMARQLGIDARFQEVFNLPTWNRKGELVMLNRHMNARVFLPGFAFDVDFNPFGDRKEFSRRVVSDERAFAQYYNNIGAEHFVKGRLDTAIDYFQKSLSIDPEVSFAWSNLGVAYKKFGRLREAEKAYLQALAQNKREYTAMTNIAKLYNETGRQKEAEPYLKKVESFRKKNPYYHFDRGEKAYFSGNFDDAVHHYKRAIRRKDKDHEFYFSLARAYFKLGEHRKATQALKKAAEYAPDVFNKDRYSQKLEMLAKVD